MRLFAVTCLQRLLVKNRGQKGPGRKRIYTIDGISFRRNSSVFRREEKCLGSAGMESLAARIRLEEPETCYVERCGTVSKILNVSNLSQNLE